MHGRMLPASFVALAIVTVVSGCSLLDAGPPRDADGRVTEATTISARDVTKGDCFTFNSADGGVVAEVTVMPCSQKHDYLVIGQGSLSTADVTTAGSLQHAVSAACAAPFTEFKATITGTTRPKQEFLVFAENDEKGADQLYSCISTDPEQ